MKSSSNKRIKHGTANSLLGFASLHILANNYQPLMRALYVQKLAAVNVHGGVNLDNV